MYNLQNNIGAMASMQMLSRTDNNDTMSLLFFQLLFSSLLVTAITTFTNCLQAPDFKKYITFLIEYFNIGPQRYYIHLQSKQYFNKFGRRFNDITCDKLSVLYYIQHHIDSYSDVYKLEHDYSDEFSPFGDPIGQNMYYTINQHREILLLKEGKYYISARSYIENDSESGSVGINGEKKNSSDLKMCKVNNLVLSSNKSPKYIKDFISMCCKFRKDEIQKDKNRYIYTYIGEDDQKNIVYEKELFSPYASFSGLVGSQIRKIEQEFDFFVSPEGKQWYKNRHIPYQLTHLYYGQPGVGKSIVASAVAQKYNLHIVRIKLSDLSNSHEFSKVFRNRTFDEKKIDYENILYLFDEIDIELEKIIQKNKQKALAKSTTRNSSSNKEVSLIDPPVQGPLPLHDFDSDLTLGTILEEINGINQMYGRKMIFITNNIDKLREIHHGALIRPGRVDRIVEFSRCKTSDVVKLMKQFFPQERVSRNIQEKILDKVWTAAQISNYCKVSKSITDALALLHKETNNPSE